jgi:translation initiation factor 3 subunit F
MSSQFHALSLRAGPTRLQYKVHPVVIFSILDHHKRRNENQPRVIGTLLGEYDDTKTECHIKNCFPVPHNEDVDQIVLQDDYHQTMLALHKRVNPHEVVVGWYSSSDNITYVSSLVHQAYGKLVEEPVLVTVDVNVRKLHRMAFKAYIGKEIRVGAKASIARFESVNMDVFSYESEKIAIDALINGAPDSDKLDAPATILTDFENLENSLQKLHSLIQSMCKYLQKVQSGQIKGDNEIGMAISQAVAVIPHLTGSAFEKMFAQNAQDLLMVMYLTNVTRTHLLLADKINYLLSDKP